MFGFLYGLFCGGVATKEKTQAVNEDKITRQDAINKNMLTYIDYNGNLRACKDNAICYRGYKQVGNELHDCIIARYGNTEIIIKDYDKERIDDMLMIRGKNHNKTVVPVSFVTINNRQHLVVRDKSTNRLLVACTKELFIDGVWYKLIGIYIDKENGTFVRFSDEEQLYTKEQLDSFVPILKEKIDDMPVYSFKFL